MEDIGEILSQLSPNIKCDILNFTGASIFTVNNISFKTVRQAEGGVKHPWTPFWLSTINHSICIKQLFYICLQAGNQT